MAFCEGSVVNEYIRSCNDTLFKTKIDEIDTPFKTKSSENHTLSGRTSPLRPYRGVPPPGYFQVILTRINGTTIELAEKKRTVGR